MPSLPIRGNAGRPDQVQILGRHILLQLAKHRESSSAAGAASGEARKEGKRAPPLVVGVQGPQGSGKTTVTLALRALLAQTPHNLNVAAFSIDDLYLPHSGLVSVARSDPSNVLLSGRGQPGTHDVALGSTILRSLSTLNDASSSEVLIPTFDKSAFAGEGDRSSEWTSVKPPLDVVLFEGWCLGFSSLGPAALSKRYAAASEEWSALSAAGKKGKRPYFLDHPLAHLERIDANLDEWREAWYGGIGCFVQLVPITEEEARANEGEGEVMATGSLEEGGDEDASLPPAPPSASKESLEIVFQWRGEAERKMKADNGGKGMSEEGVRKFVERYMPGYELFAAGINDEGMPWRGKGLRVAIDAQRKVRGVSRF